jgi:hypothetical protein
MKFRTVVIAGFGVGMLVAASQGCLYDCITLTSQQPKLCADLFEVLDAGGGGAIVDDLGKAPRGCACLSVHLRAVFDEDGLNPELDGLYAEIEANARLECQQLATDAGQDPSACQSAVLDKGTRDKTKNTFKECTQVIGELDENRDGNCVPPEGVWVPGETGGPGESESDSGETGGGGIVVLDLGFGPAP